MPKDKSLPKNLKFLSKKPSTAIYNLSKKEAYPYLEKLVLTKGPLGKTKDLLPGYVTHLSSSDKTVGEIPPEEIKTANKFIESIYYDLKNAAAKVKKEIKDKHIIPHDPTKPVPQPPA